MSQRTREIGIRVALGANRWGIARDVATSRHADRRGRADWLFAGVLSYEFLELTGPGGSVPGAVAMASVLGVSVMLLVSLTVHGADAARVADRADGRAPSGGIASAGLEWRLQEAA